MDPAYEEKEKQTFWLSLFSAVGVLVILGIILYLSQGSNKTQGGIGGGPGEQISPSPSPFESPSEMPTINPRSYSL